MVTFACNASTSEMRTLNKSEKLKNDQTGRFGHTPRVAAVGGTRRSNPIFFIYGGARQPAGCGRPPRKKKGQTTMAGTALSAIGGSRWRNRYCVSDRAIGDHGNRTVATKIPRLDKINFVTNFGFQFNFVTENADVTASGHIKLSRLCLHFTAV